MRSPALAPFCLAVAVATTACGSPKDSPSMSQPAVFPLTITRIGGVAGFHDVLVVNGEGLVSVTQKGRTRWQCRLTPVAARRVATATSALPWPRLTASSTSAGFSDDLVTLVQSPAGGPVRLEDPQTGAAGTIFNELINDLRGGWSASGMCRPV
ncbi:MAG: hypothetical protein H7270_09530 [Dermatophilaceae bacterium]|nr:hypothetical protein [Dermatophilaceae bacterium]